MPLTRRDLLIANLIGAFLAPLNALAAPLSGALTPEQFGAQGDGRTNDTAAFAAMAARVQRAGGGEIVLRKGATYVVGQQRMMSGQETGYSFEPAKILDFVALHGSLTIRGNGAKLKCAPGLRYGTFAPASGQATRHAMPYIQGGELATPYRAMILVENCTGPVAISDLELDGSLKTLRVGGKYGDTGWQIPAVGIILRNNRGGERLTRIKSHDHALDGVMIDGVDAPGAGGLLDQVLCARNGRQGCSVVGGRNYRFQNCHFIGTGKGGISSAPGAGCDIEAEGGKKVRNLSFSDCRFADNSGAGLVSDSGDSANVAFERCIFVGTTNWAAWPNKPGFRFTDCTFVGAIVHAFASEDPREATQFNRCIFTDDPAKSPTGSVYGGDGAVPMVDLGGSYRSGKNVAFRNSRFTMVAGGKLPWTVGTIYENVTMIQASKSPAYPRGIFLGTSTIRGPVDLYSSRVEGSLLVNGVPTKL